MEKRTPNGELKKHASGMPERFVFVDGRNNPSGKLYAMVRTADADKEPTGSEPRVHSVDSVMMFIGRGPDLEGLEAEVEVQGKKYRVKSPAAVYVRAGQRHRYRLTRGSGLYQKIVLADGGDYNKVTS